MLQQLAGVVASSAASAEGWRPSSSSSPGPAGAGSRARAASPDVFTPTLSGLGERVHLVHPGIDLDTHIQDVLGVLEYDDLHDVVLVGHSYGTMVITGAADRLPGRIATSSTWMG